MISPEKGHHQQDQLLSLAQQPQEGMLYTTEPRYDPLVSCCDDGSRPVSAETASTMTLSRNSDSDTNSPEEEENHILTTIMTEEERRNYNESPCWTTPEPLQVPQQYSSMPQVWQEEDEDALYHAVPIVAPLLYRPQARRLPHQPPLHPQPSQQNPVRVDVPFLVNYEDVLTYGPQRLPTVLEVEDEDEEDDEEPEEAEPRISKQRQEEPETEGTSVSDDSGPHYPETATSTNLYSYVDCYPDHRWDLARGDAVLSEAMYYHVLEATNPAGPAAVVAMLDTPVETQPRCNLFKPQAMRVVCPTTIAPVLRENDEQEVDQECQPKEYFNLYRYYLEGLGEEMPDFGLSQQERQTPQIEEEEWL